VGYDRPGWLRFEQFGAGMITGWGTHHVDSAHWGMDTEYTGPIEIWAKASFPKSGLWDVHGSFTSHGIYANGVKMTISTELPNGIKYVGTEGWVFVTRGAYKASPNEPTVPNQKALSASDPRIIESVIGPNEINLYRSNEHHGNWLECIQTRKQPITPVELGHRACSTCLIHHMAMKLGRKLNWDPLNEKFINDDEANSLLNRQHRYPYLVKGLS